MEINFLKERVFALIDLDAVIRNAERLKSKFGNKIIAVLKADGYGLGGTEIARALEHTVEMFGVATLDEAIALRRGGIQSEILILGYVPSDCLSEISKNRLIATVYSLSSAKQLSLASAECVTDVYIAVDTGMSRLGFLPNEYVQLKSIFSLKGLRVQGVFSHLSCADNDKKFTNQQMKTLQMLMKQLQNDGVTIGQIHICNSAAVINGVSAGRVHGDAARCGIALYGAYPDLFKCEQADLENVITISSTVVQLKTIKEGSSVGYGRTFVAKRTTKLAIIGAGYADGYPTALSNKGYVLIRGKRAQIVGRICMDYFMTDVTDIPTVQEGDRVLLLGKDGKEIITVHTLQEIANVFPYEFLCNLNPRVSRYYLINGILTKNSNS